MNTKAALGLVAAVIILAGALFFSHKAGAPAPALMAPLASTTTTVATSTAPLPIGIPVTTTKPTPAPTKKIIGAFDMTTFTTAESHPRVTGTAQTKEVQVVIINDAGVGIVGGMHVPVVNGHWVFVSSRELAPGTYVLQLGGVDPIVTAALVVTAP